MKIGIVGLPNVGKSTLFKALTKIQVDISNYPFCTIEPNVGIVEVPDARVDKLAELSHSKKKVYATIEFVDIAGLVKGASEGQGLGNKFLQNIREVDAIAEVVRLFENSNITHVHETIDPKRDIEIINTELILADLETVGKRLSKTSKEAKTGNKEKIKEAEILNRLKSILDSNDLTAVQTFIKDLGDDFDLIKDLHLLSFKPILYVFNTANPETIKTDLEKWGLKEIKYYTALNIKNEEDAFDLSDEEKIELEIKSDLADLIAKSYQMLGTITFLTTGEAETRAWKIPLGSTAPRAGRAIHSDFEEKFICAEIIKYDDYLKAGSRTKARELGLARIEGKNSIIEDGDVIEFKI